MTIHITQNGSDGFGHQLYGLFSCLILHGVGNYYFDGHYYVNKIFRFDHIDKKQVIIMKNYLIKAINLFIEDYKVKPIKYKKIIHSHEVYKIPVNYDNDILYSLDNAYYFNTINLNEEERKKHLLNINIMKKYFINDNLSKSRLKKNNIVIHVRLGDAMNYNELRKRIMDHNKKIPKLIDALKNKYPDHHYYIHSDGNVPWLLKKLNKNYTLFKKNTRLIDVISDFIHAKIFICGVSGLSHSCSFFGNKELIIVSDGEKHSLPKKNCYHLSDYLKNLQQNYTIL